MRKTTPLDVIGMRRAEVDRYRDAHQRAWFWVEGGALSYCGPVRSEGAECFLSVEGVTLFMSWETLEKLHQAIGAELEDRARTVHPG